MNERILGANVRQIRRNLGVSLTDLAKKADLTKSTVSKLETGQISSPISTLIRIADALGVHVGEFFTPANDSPTFVVTRRDEGRVITKDGTRFGY